MQACALLMKINSCPSLHKYRQVLGQRGLSHVGPKYPAVKDHWHTSCTLTPIPHLLRRIYKKYMDLTKIWPNCEFLEKKCKYALSNGLTRVYDGTVNFERSEEVKAYFHIYAVALRC